MPKGIYPRTANQLRAAKVNLAKGREPAARALAGAKLRALGQDEAWQKRVSQGTKKAMRRPDVRARHLKGLALAQTVNFKGGNGQPPLTITMQLIPFLGRLGFTTEYPVKTSGHGTTHNPPTSYKVDFGNPVSKIAVELDGQAHRPHAKRALDQKKTEVLQALGWFVVRIKH